MKSWAFITLFALGLASGAQAYSWQEMHDVDQQHDLVNLFARHDDDDDDDDDRRSRDRFRVDDRPARIVFEVHERGEGSYWMEHDDERKIGGVNVKILGNGTFEVVTYAGGKKDFRGTWKEGKRDTIDLTLREGFGQNRIKGKGTVYLSRDGRTFYGIQLEGRLDERRDHREFEMDFRTNSFYNANRRDDRPDWLPGWVADIFRNDRDEDFKGRNQTRSFSCNVRITGQGAFDYGDTRNARVDAVRVNLDRNGEITVSVAGVLTRNFKGTWWEDRPGRVIFTLKGAGPRGADAEGWLNMGRDNKSISRIEFSGGGFHDGVRLKFEERRDR